MGMAVHATNNEVISARDSEWIDLARDVSIFSWVLFVQVGSDLPQHTIPAIDDVILRCG